MNVVLYGATGNAGRRILAELTSREHHVTAVARNPVNLPPGVETAGALPAHRRAFREMLASRALPRASRGMQVGRHGRRTLSGLPVRTSDARAVRAELLLPAYLRH